MGEAKLGMGKRIEMAKNVQGETMEVCGKQEKRLDKWKDLGLGSWDFGGNFGRNCVTFLF